MGLHRSLHGIATEHGFPFIAGLLFAGMSVPFVAAATSAGLLSMYVSGDQFLVLWAAIFGLVIWALLARFDLDQVQVAFASVALPFLFAFPLRLLGEVLDAAGPTYVLGDFGDWLEYAGAFMGAGVGAVALQRGAERLSGTYDWLPAPGTLAVVVLAAVVVAPVAVGGAVAHATATPASVSTVEQARMDIDTPGLNVTVEGPQTEMWLTVTGPDGTSTTRRLSHASMADGETTTSVGFRQVGPSEPRTGTYQVAVDSISGLTVDTTSYEIERPATPSIVAVETARSGERLILPAVTISSRDAWSRGLQNHCRRISRVNPHVITAGSTSVSHRSNSEVEPFDFGSKSSPRVGVLLENRGEVADSFQVRLVVDDRAVTRPGPVYAPFVEPGQYGATALPLSEADVDRIEEAGGSFTVEVVYGETVERREVTLPDSEG